MTFDTVWRNARLATMVAGAGPLGMVETGAIAVRDGRIAFVGAQVDLPAPNDAKRTINCEGRLVTPGFVDCHTHLVHGGHRAREFEMRLAGASYADIAIAGGGIASTVRATREASDESLVASALVRLDCLISEGVTTVEIKSGYGLERSEEMRLLRVARALETKRDIAVCTTFLGAHALPPAYDGDKDRYIDLVCADMLPAVARENLADAVDAFCEGIAFSPAQTARVFDAAKALGIPIKLHADQLSNLGGAALAAAYGALSADHLEHADETGLQAMAKAGTVAVLLPGAYYFLRDTHLPPTALCRKLGVPMALATDCNPGTSPLTSILLVLNMGATLFGMTVDECLLGVTRHAAAALGRAKSIGTLERGKFCDLAIWDVESPAELVYRMGFNPLHSRIWRGR